MDASEIDKLEAGPDLDVLIAEKVMGLPRLDTDLMGRCGTFFGSPDNPLVCHKADAYSTSISAAWQVVEKLRERFPVIRIGTGDLMGKFWQASFYDAYYEAVAQGKHGDFADADTLPLAICRAALRAVRVPHPAQAEGA